MPAPTTQNNVTVQNNVNVTAGANSIYPDAKAERDEKLIMDSQKEVAKYFSISNVLKFVTSVLLPVALGAITVAATKAFDAGSMASFATAPGMVGIALLTTAVVTTGAAIATDYIASRKATSIDVKKYELGAQHTARHTRLELQGKKVRPINPSEQIAPLGLPQEQKAVNSLQTIEPVIYEQNKPPANGKTWLQVSGKDPEQLALAAQANVNAQMVRG